MAPQLPAPAKLGRRLAHGRPDDTCLDTRTEASGLAARSHLHRWNIDEPSIFKELPACQGTDMSVLWSFVRKLGLIVIVVPHQCPRSDGSNWQLQDSRWTKIRVTLPPTRWLLGIFA